jgi:type IVB pilus formation R64 PilN family outer membrane protein
MKQPSLRLISTALIASSVLNLQGCGIAEIRDSQAAVVTQARGYADTPQRGRPVVVIHKGSWLLGEKVTASKPQPEIYDKIVSWKDKRAVTLRDITTWIAETVGVRAVVDASAANSSMQRSAAAAPLPLGTPTPSGGPLPGGMLNVGGLGAIKAPDLSTPLQQGFAGGQSVPARASFSYEGDFGGFVDVVDAKFGVWSKYHDGTVSFFTTETRTFEIASLNDVSSMTGSISTSDGNNSSGSQGGGAQLGSSQSGGSSSNAGGSGQQMSLTVIADPWSSLQTTASAVAGPGANVVADKNLKSLTITGTPPQCDRLETWVKGLNAQFGKQVAVDVTVYQVQVTNEHNYGLNLSLAYHSPNGHTGITVSGAQAPNIVSTTSPMTLGASIVGGTLGGTQAAVQALSTLGNVSTVVSRSGITQNGKLLALQAAEEQDYVTSNQSTLVASVGATNATQTTTLRSGFTGNFMPSYLDGKIVVDFDMTLSDRPTFTTFPPNATGNTSSVQLKHRDVTRFTQNVSLKPGESLVLTGMHQQNTSVTNNGVGTPGMALLGGGVDAQKGDQIIAVVLTARLY